MGIVTGIEYFQKECDGIVIPGTYFNCIGYRTLELSAKSCGHRYIDAQRLAHEIERGHPMYECLACPVGQQHADATEVPPKPPRDRKCARCGRGDMRLADQNLCVCCFNRQREAITGKNGKGTYPAQIARKLHWGYAIVQAASKIGLERFHNEDRHRNGLPSATTLEPGIFWVSAVVGDERELRESIVRRIPGATILELELSPSLLELHAANSH